MRIIFFKKNILSISDFLISFLVCCTMLLALGACGSVSVGTVNPNPGPDPIPSESTEENSSRVYFFATDYVSSGQLFVANLVDSEISVTNSGITLLGSSAIVRAFDDQLYILHDGFSTISNDNVQIISPSQNFTTLGQFSTGNGTNPKDIAVVGDRAFISLYNNSEASGNPGDVIAIDLSEGSILNRFAFQNDLTSDGDLNANADQMTVAGDNLYVTLGDLESNTFAATAPGKLGVIDTTSSTQLDTIVLNGRNPVSLAADDSGERLAVAHMATYNFATGNFDLSPSYGGLEIIDIATGTTSLFLHDEDLGGYVERVESDNHNFYFVVSDFDAVSFSYSSRILTIPHNADSIEDVRVLDDEGSDIREIAIHNAYLWISRREINSQNGMSEPVLDVIDLFNLMPAANTYELPVPAMSLIPAL